MIKINGYKFDGGGSCPEQYYVYKEDKCVAYVRLRWGNLTVDTKPLGDRICDYCPKGALGDFNSEKQRQYYLGLIVKRIEEYYKPQKPKRKYTKKKENSCLNIGTNELFTSIFNDIMSGGKIEDNGIKIKRENSCGFRKLGEPLKSKDDESVKGVR